MTIVGRIVPVLAAEVLHPCGANFVCSCCELGDWTSLGVLASTDVRQLQGMDGWCVLHTWHKLVTSVLM